MTFDPMAAAAAEFEWLKDHPDFWQKPATIEEFLGPGYLEFEEQVRPAVKQALIDIFGAEVQDKRIAVYQRAMFTGAIGIGKTTLASIALPYMVHWVLCLKDPQKFFGLLPGSRIAFMQMSTSAKNALEVIFGDIKARVDHSPWFIENAPRDEKIEKMIKFPGKDIWILPGDSAETTFEGYNILGGILDEMDSHKVTEDKDYAQNGYDTIINRIKSRFGNRGLLILVGQMKKATGFAAGKYEEFLTAPDAHVTRLAIWESFGWDYMDYEGKQPFLNPDGTHNSFFYDPKRKEVITAFVASLLDRERLDGMIEVPTFYQQEFESAPEKTLKDLAGIPPAVSDPFISLVDRIELCRSRWIERHGDESPVLPNSSRVEFAKWFTNVGSKYDPRKRAIQLDMAYSAEGDALGMAMGHIEEFKEVNGERRPVIVMDFIARVKAPSGNEIMFSDIRNIIYYLRDDLNFKVKAVGIDGFQSTDTKQILRKKRFEVNDISMDKSTLPYEDLREAIYEERLEFPPYVTYMEKGKTELVEILPKELAELTDTGKKIDHPAKGSKDVADAVAGVVHQLIGDRSYRRGAGMVAPSAPSGHTPPTTPTPPRQGFPSGLPSILAGIDGLRAPVPPSAPGRLQVPPHLGLP